MSSGLSLLDKSQEQAAEEEVTWEDQQRINSFSKFNKRLQDFEEELAKKKQEKEYLDDLSMELELADEDEQVLYKLGEAFLHLPLHRVQKLLENDAEALDEQIDTLKAAVDECEGEMSKLKVLLKSKFQDAINLEP